MIKDVVQLMLRYYMLSMHDRLTILQLYAFGFSPAEISSRLGVSRKFVAALLNRFPHSAKTEKIIGATITAIQKLRPPVVFEKNNGVWRCRLCGREFDDVMTAAGHLVRHEEYGRWLDRLVSFVERLVVGVPVIVLARYPYIERGLVGDVDAGVA